MLSKARFIILSVILIQFVKPIQSANDDIHHEEFHKSEEKSSNTDRQELIFLKKSERSHLPPTPKRCLKDEERYQKRRRNSKNKNNPYITTWIEFLNDFYWEDGYEYRTWTKLREKTKKEKQGGSEDPSDLKMLLYLLAPLALYIASILFTGVVAPLLSFVLFRTCIFVWDMISSDFTEYIMRRLWIKNQIRKRKQVMLIYSWAKKLPKIREQLPWAMRHSPEEDLPPEMTEFIPQSSSPESSIGEDNEDYIYDGFESATEIDTLEKKEGVDLLPSDIKNPQSPMFTKRNLHQKSIRPSPGHAQPTHTTAHLKSHPIRSEDASNHNKVKDS